VDKRAALVALGTKRRNTRWPGYNCIGDYHEGRYECEFVSPYTKTAGNVDSGIFIMLQDWASDDMLNGPFEERMDELGHNPDLDTNQNLNELLRATFGRGLSEVFGTNLFPFVKLGNGNATIPLEDLTRAAEEYGLPQIRIVRPKRVICLGLDTFNAVREACAEQRCKDMSSARRSPFSFQFQDTQSEIVCQAHTGWFGQMNRKRQGIDPYDEWRGMRE